VYFWINGNTGKHHHDIAGNGELIDSSPKKQKKLAQAAKSILLQSIRWPSAWPRHKKTPPSDGAFVIRMQPVT
jgi:hypothetical protein